MKPVTFYKITAVSAEARKRSKNYERRLRFKGLNFFEITAETESAVIDGNPETAETQPSNDILEIFPDASRDELSPENVRGLGCEAEIEVSNMYEN